MQWICGYTTTFFADFRFSNDLLVPVNVLYPQVDQPWGATQTIGRRVNLIVRH